MKCQGHESLVGCLRQLGPGLKFYQLTVGERVQIAVTGYGAHDFKVLVS